MSDRYRFLAGQEGSSLICIEETFKEAREKVDIAVLNYGNGQKNTGLNLGAGPIKITKHRAGKDGAIGLSEGKSTIFNLKLILEEEK